jgi:hypothetical protein
MRRTVIGAVLAGLAIAPVVGAKAPTLKGTYVEARTEEVFAGGCVMNGEAGTAGREAVLAWKVGNGQFNGVPLDGLSVVAAVAADTNLGIREIGGPTATTRTALFVDQRASAAQQLALIQMARQLSNGVVDAVVKVTPSPIQFVDESNDIRVDTNAVRLTVQKAMTHDPTCGGRQWFHPLSVVDDAMMGTTAENAFTGTALGRKWSDPNKHSSFFGTFSY